MDPIAQLFPTPIGQAIGWTILHSLWQAMVIAIISAMLLLLLRNQQASIRYRVAGAGMALILLSAMLTFYWYCRDEIKVPATASATTQSFVQQAVPNDAVSAEPQGKPAIASLEAIQAYLSPHLSMIALCWCFGFAVCFLRLLGHIGQVHYLKTQRNFPADEYWIEMKDQLLQKAGMKKAVALVESTLVRTPLIIGHLKPYIMFPIGFINRLDPLEAEAIIAHEIAHILRRDYLFNILQSLVESIFYYHPAVWWLSSTMRREREIAADELAISLTGNAVTYAKALVVVQELAYFPLSPALAFAGKGKSELFTRVQRILYTKNSKSFVMEKFISAGIFLLIIAGLTFAQSNVSTTDQPEISNSNSSLPGFSAADSSSGIWQGKIENDKLCLTMLRGKEGHHWSNADCYALSDFSALPKGQGSFTLSREAGTITFSGVFEGKEGFGRFSFQENPAFYKMLADNNIKGMDESVMIILCLNNVNADFIKFLKQKGYHNIDADELTGLAVHGLDKAAISSYLQLFEKAGQKNVPIDDLMSFKIHGIDDEFIQQMKSMGFEHLSLDDIMSAKIHGITPEFVKSCRDLGFGNPSFDDIMSFKIHGMDAEFLSDLKNAGFGNLSADEAMSFKIHGITPEYINQLKAAGLTKLNADDLLSFKIHGFTPEVIASYRNLGFKNIDNDQMMSLRIHGIDAVFIDSYKTIFDKPLELDEVMSLKIHDVTPEFIRRAREKGFKDMSVDEYIQLKIQFGDKVK